MKVIIVALLVFLTTATRILASYDQGSLGAGFGFQITCTLHTGNYPLPTNETVLIDYVIYTGATFLCSVTFEFGHYYPGHAWVDVDPYVLDLSSVSATASNSGTDSDGWFSGYFPGWLPIWVEYFSPFEDLAGSVSSGGTADFTYHPSTATVFRYLETSYSAY